MNSNIINNNDTKTIKYLQQKKIQIFGHDQYLLVPRIHGEDRQSVSKFHRFESVLSVY